MNVLMFFDIVCQIIIVDFFLDWVGMQGIVFFVQIGGQRVVVEVDVGVSLDDLQVCGIYMLCFYLVLVELEQGELDFFCLCVVL